MGFARVRLLIFISVVTAISTIPAATSQNFNCTSPARCQALVGYTPKNATSMSAILSLFNIFDPRSVLGANNLPLSTSRNYTVSAEQTIRIPIPCTCSNGAGVSNGMPVYTIQPGDGLFDIASRLFSGLVNSAKIQEANNIRNANVIVAGENLTIPLPCSCDDVNGENVVHYAHVVKSGSSFDSIAQEFGTDKDTLMRINGIANETELLADQTIDVPLRACNSSIRRESPDSSLRVTNGTYVITANNCVRCQCDSANNWILQCEPSQLEPSRWASCPATTCESADVPFLGNSTSSGCNSTFCAYAGFNNRAVLTTLDTLSTCPSSNPTNYAPSVRLSWRFLVISISSIFLCLHHLL